MDTDKIIEHLLESHKRIKYDNPLRDLPKDCVLVIHPRHVAMLDRIGEANPVGHGRGLLAPRILGIPIYVENRAPQDKFEFMGLTTYYAKYPTIVPKQYSKMYVFWDNFMTMIRRWYMQLKSRLSDK